MISDFVLCKDDTLKKLISGKLWFYFFILRLSCVIYKQNCQLSLCGVKMDSGFSFLKASAGSSEIKLL